MTALVCLVVSETGVPNRWRFNICHTRNVSNTRESKEYWCGNILEHKNLRKTMFDVFKLMNFMARNNTQVDDFFILTID